MQALGLAFFIMIAICTTVRGLDHNFLDWLSNHVSLGVQRFYTFLDAPLEDSDFEKNLPPNFKSLVTILHHDEVLKASYLEIPEYEQFKTDLDRLVVNRQCLNTHVALELAIKDKIDWLIHIDADELIGFPQSHESLNDYLMALPDEIDSYIFPTMESIPRSKNLKNYFREIIHFKISPYLLPFHQLDRLMQGWRMRGQKFPLFNAHLQGKAAFRVSKYPESFTPHSVHEFVEYRWSSSVLVSQTWQQPFLYHFPFSGLDMFLQRFSGINKNRMNTYDKGVFGYNFYQEVNDYLEKGLNLEELYERRVMCSGDFEYLEKYGYICVKKFGSTI